MIEGRQVKDRPWDVFQHAHWGWYFTDETSVIRGPFDNENAARTACDLHRKPFDVLYRFGAKTEE